MKEIGRPERPAYPVANGALGPEERRLVLEKRIRELRRKKRAEQRRSKRPLRIALALLLALLILISISSGIYVLASGGEAGVYNAFEIPASNLSSFDSLILEQGEVSAPAISASAAILVDNKTGDVLYEVNADQSLPMASTTKIMTALLVLENAPLDENATVSAYAGNVGESSAWLEAGEILTVEQLLYALMLQSANDAAVVLAEHVGGSEEAFVVMMNDRASELGLQNTSFANPHGLDTQGHYTSARDLAAIASQAMAIPKFREVVTTGSYEIPWPGHPYTRVMENHNKFIKLYPAATGIKTGYTYGAGKCLVASAQKDGRELISVILNGGESYWDQTICLMDYGFDDFTLAEFAYSGQPLAEVEVGDLPRRKVDAVGSGDMVFTVRRDRLASYRSASINCLEWIPYPVKAGQEVGYMVIAEGTPQESRETLVSGEYRNTPNFLVRLLSFIWAVFESWWMVIKWLIPGL